MKPDYENINVDVYPSCTTLTYQLPCGDLFKRKYVLYTKAAALAEFKRELRELKL